nr:MAG TPA: hypothetical protein [Caudoviricetes sp.]
MRLSTLLILVSRIHPPYSQFFTSQVQIFTKFTLNWYFCFYVELCYNNYVKKSHNGGTKMLIPAKNVRELPDDMDIIDGMPASRPSSPDRSRRPWEG